MEIKKYNISKPKKYLSGGVEKTQWQNCGTITEFYKDNGEISRIIEIPAIGLEANIFPFVDKTAGSQPREVEQEVEKKVETTSPNEYGEAINPEDIPF